MKIKARLANILFTKSLFLISFFFSLLSVVPLSAQVPGYNYKAYQRGELLEYNIHYGLINAGRIVMKVENNYVALFNQNLIQFSTKGTTYAGWDYFFKVRDYYVSYIDTNSLFPVYSIRNILEGDYISGEYVIYKREQGLLNCNNIEQKLPVDLFDILSAFYYARCYDFNKIPLNTEIVFNTFFEKELFKVGISYEGKTIVKTKLGTFNCLIIRPALIQGRVFKGQKDMTLYISDDKNHIPIRVESAIFVGYIQADLDKFQNLKYPLTSRIY
jgi:hypothetical protein